MFFSIPQYTIDSEYVIKQQMQTMRQSATMNIISLRSVRCDAISGCFACAWFNTVDNVQYSRQHASNNTVLSASKSLAMVFTFRT